MSERRRRQRLPWVSMDARVRVRKGLIGMSWVNVQVIDYNRLGMGIVTDEEILRPDSRIQISLRLGPEIGDITVDQVPAQVRHAAGHEQGYFFGLEFEEDVGKGVVESLERIEGILNRHQNLAERLRE